jgi:hypothetical protein
MRLDADSNLRNRSTELTTKSVKSADRFSLVYRWAKPLLTVLIQNVSGLSMGKISAAGADAVSRI